MYDSKYKVGENGATQHLLTQNWVNVKVLEPRNADKLSETKLSMCINEALVVMFVADRLRYFLLEQDVRTQLFPSTSQTYLIILCFFSLFFS